MSSYSPELLVPLRGQWHRDSELLARAVTLIANMLTRCVLPTAFCPNQSAQLFVYGWSMSVDSLGRQRALPPASAHKKKDRKSCVEVAASDHNNNNTNKNNIKTRTRTASHIIINPRLHNRADQH